MGRESKHGKPEGQGSQKRGKAHCEGIIAADELSRLAGYPFHRGAIAQAREPETPPLPPGSELPDRGILGLGVKTVFLGPGNPWEYGRKVLRSAMGAQFRLNLFRFGSSAELDGDYLERAYAKQIIPQSPAVDSLNVNVAAESAGPAAGLGEFPGEIPPGKDRGLAAVRG